MPTQASAGYNGTLDVSPDGGTTWHGLGELQEAKVKVDVDMADATSHASGGVKEQVPLNSKWQVTAAALRVFSDAGQVDLDNALSGKTKLKLRIRPAGVGTGKVERSGFAYLSSWEETAPNSGLVAENLTFEGTGALAFTVQP